MVDFLLTTKIQSCLTSLLPLTGVFLHSAEDPLFRTELSAAVQELDSVDSMVHVVALLRISVLLAFLGCQSTAFSNNQRRCIYTSKPPKALEEAGVWRRPVAIFSSNSNNNIDDDGSSSRDVHDEEEFRSRAALLSSSLKQHLPSSSKLFAASGLLAFAALASTAPTFDMQALPFEASARNAFLLVILQPAVEAYQDEGQFSIPFGPQHSYSTLVRVSLATFGAIYVHAIREMSVLLVLPMLAEKISAVVDGRQLPKSRDTSIAVATVAALSCIVAAS